MKDRTRDFLVGYLQTMPDCVAKAALEDALAMGSICYFGHLIADLMAGEYITVHRASSLLDLIATGEGY